MACDSFEAYYYLYQCFVRTARSKGPFKRQLVANLPQDLKRSNSKKSEKSIRSSITDLRSTLERAGLHLPGFEPVCLVARARSLSLERVATGVLASDGLNANTLKQLVPDPDGVDSWLQHLTNQSAQVHVRSSTFMFDQQVERHTSARSLASYCR